MHIETVSLKQEYHPSTFMLRAEGLKSALVKQKMMQPTASLKGPWIVTRWETCQSQNYQHLDKGLFIFCVNTATETYPSRVIHRVARGKGLLHSMTGEENCSMGEQSSCHVGI